MQLRRAVERGQLLAAESAARECPHVDLDLALGICLLMTHEGDERFERATLRWIARLTVEGPGLTLSRLGEVVEALDELQGVAPDVARSRLSVCLRAMKLDREARVAEQLGTSAGRA